MKKGIKKLLGYTLLEMLLVLGIFLILGSFGVGGIIGTRETMVAKENVERVIQDIRSVRLKAILGERDNDDPWIYGYGIDFRNVANGEYKIFKWCSMYDSFSDPDDQVGRLKSELLAWDHTRPVDNYWACTKPYLCGLIPYSASTHSCDYYLLYGGEGIEYLTGYQNDKFIPTKGEIFVLQSSDVTLPGSLRTISFIVFESLTGRAFLYGTGGQPVNYWDTTADTIVYDDTETFNLVIQRQRSSKFDVITVYPLSGIVIHHVYSSRDKADSGYCTLNPNQCITVDEVQYKKYGIEQEINSYRE